MPSQNRQRRGTRSEHGKKQNAAHWGTSEKERNGVTTKNEAYKKGRPEGKEEPKHAQSQDPRKNIFNEGCGGNSQKKTPKEK